jgi:O-antigen/teichoic acid export membrane protein
MNPGSHYHKYMNDQLALLLAQVLVYARGVILLPILIRTAGVSVYGSYVLMMSAASFVFATSSLGVGFRFQRFIPSAGTPEERSALFYPQFMFQLTMVLVLGALLIVFEWLINDTLLKDAGSVSGWAVAMQVVCLFLFTQGTDYFRYTHRVRLFAFATGLSPYLSLMLIGGVLLLSVPASVNLLLVLTATAMLIVALPLIVGTVREIGVRLVLPTFNQIVQDVRLGLPLVLTYVLDFVLSASDRFLLAYFLSAQAVGYYAPAYTLASIVLMVPKAIGVALPPMLSRLVDAKQGEEAAKLTGTALRFYLLLAIPFVAGCAMLGTDLLTLLANADVAARAGYVPGILALGMLFYGLNLILSSSVAFVTLHTADVVVANVIAGAASVILNVILIPVVRDITAPAVVAVCSFLLSYLFLFRRLQPLMDVRIPFPFVMRAVLASAVMACVLIGLKAIIASHGLIIVIGIPVAVVVYLFAAVRTGALTPSDRMVLKSLVPAWMKPGRTGGGEEGTDKP